MFMGSERHTMEVAPGLLLQPVIRVCEVTYLLQLSES